MTEVVGVRFERAGKIYYFASGDLKLAYGDHVIVDSSRGLDFGIVTTPVQEIDEATLSQPLRPVVRLATEADEQSYEAVRKLEPAAFAYCQQQIERFGLPMKLIRVSYTFDGSKVVFYFSSENRVDFRELVKVLAGHFHTRIELRQVGVRDEARIVGGYSTCGRELCCASFLENFHPVSIKMAKKQNLALNPAKISGVCGRLMCCLYYEYDEDGGPDEEGYDCDSEQNGEKIGCAKKGCVGCGGRAAEEPVDELLIQEGAAVDSPVFKSVEDFTASNANTQNIGKKGSKGKGRNPNNRGPRKGRRPAAVKAPCDNNCRECQQPQCSRRRPAVDKGE